MFLKMFLSVTMQNLMWAVKFSGLTAIGRQIEDENGEKCDCDARDDQVHRVKERLASDCDVERDVRVRFWAARVVFLVLDGRNAEQIPLNARVKVLQLDTNLQRFQVTNSNLVLDDVFQVNLGKEVSK